ncbi:hypothetical protein RHODGE_RHODGE_00993 [Rhodoplanes serenus]|uniref:Uncharacterized protein n=1 Tax=Rhodoplanes serenus TaxID=200615 RepID=A0A3S4AXI4_9BRAD|nr:hypothetical protein RHODPL_RHODPL_00066 [Rhodoplanes serenus]VCU07843.1 hypothetical protein RHODGE_RHODGE_00993 [Rhodoplanes serenus]
MFASTASLVERAVQLGARRPTIAILLAVPAIALCVL